MLNCRYSTIFYIQTYTYTYTCKYKYTYVYSYIYIYIYLFIFVYLFKFTYYHSFFSATFDTFDQCMLTCSANYWHLLLDALATKEVEIFPRVARNLEPLRL